MNRQSVSWLVGLVAAFIIVVGLPARAAAADVDVAGGYSFARITNGDGENVPAGWFASVGGNIAPMFGLVFDVSGAYKTDTTTIPGGTVEAKQRMHSFVAGPRVMSPHGVVMVFGQVLVGAVRFSEEVSGTGAGVKVSASDSETHFAVQPGGGVDINATDNVGIRVGVNFRFIRPSSNESGEWGKVFQFVTGVVFHLGK